MRYTPTHKTMPRPLVVGVSSDARWRGVPSKASVVNTLAVLALQQRIRNRKARRGVK